MPSPQRNTPRRPGRGVRPWLLQAKVTGLLVLLGGLAALVMIGVRGPHPSTREEWEFLREIVTSVFWPCVFGGLALVIVAGIALWLQHPRVFLRMRWFRLKAVLLAVALPGLHFFARGRVQRWDHAIGQGSLEECGEGWQQVTAAFAIAFVVLLAIAVIGRVKPRLGERVGTRTRR